MFSTAMDENLHAAGARRSISHGVLTGMDHRWGPRIAFDVPISIMAPRGAAWDCNIREISISGALVSTRRFVPEMTHVAVRITSPVWIQHGSTLLHAYVAGCRDDGLAIGWMRLAPPLVVSLISHAAAALQRGLPAAPISMQPSS